MSAVPPLEEGIPLVLATRKVPLDNICLATLFVVIWFSQECLTVAKMEENVFAYISDECRLLKQSLLLRKRTWVTYSEA